jgi:hypothetical protein
MSILVQHSNIKCNENPFSDSRAVIRGQEGELNTRTLGNFSL